MTQVPVGPLVIVRVCPDGLHLENGEGRALYYFVPFRESKEDDPILWGSEWPRGIREWILRWPPFLGNPKAGSGVSQDALGQQNRELASKADEDYPGGQVTYRGWPLYLCDLTREPTPPGVLGLWARATIDLYIDHWDSPQGDPKRPFGGP